MRDLVITCLCSAHWACFSTGSSSGGNRSTSSIIGLLICPVLGAKPRLDPGIKTALPNVLPTRKGSAFGTQRHQSHHRSDEEKRPLGLRDGEGRLQAQAAKGRGRTDDFRRAGPAPSPRRRSRPRRPLQRQPLRPPPRRENARKEIMSPMVGTFYRAPRRNRRRSSMSGRRSTTIPSSASSRR